MNERRDEREECDDEADEVFEVGYEEHRKCRVCGVMKKWFVRKPGQEELCSKCDEESAELADLRQQLAETRDATDDEHRMYLTAKMTVDFQEQQLAAQAAELEKLRDERDHYEASSKRWLEISRNLFKLKRTYRLECESKAAELATLRERLAECDTYHAPRIAELERLNKEQFDRFSDLLSVLGNINQCRTAEGDSIEILCDNPEAWSVDKQAAVEASGAYTDYEPTKFFGSTWQEALQKAADCARRYYSG